VVLHDDGQTPDQESSDGIYTGQWTPTAAGTFTLTFPDGSVVTVTVPLQYHYEATPFRWRTINGTTLNLGDDENGTITPLPFPIRFAGSSFPTLRVNSNGILYFGGSLISYLSAGHESLPTRQLSTAEGVPELLICWLDEKQRRRACSSSIEQHLR